MLTPDQITALRDRAEQIAQPMTEYLIREIARRISEAGQLTSTAAYEIWKAQKLGLSQEKIREELQKQLKVSRQQIDNLLTRSAEAGYNFDIEKLPTSAAIPFEENLSLQKIVGASVKLAQEDFTNITQTLGMIDPYGRALPLQEAYKSAVDYAFKQVSTGAADYNTAVRQATRNLVNKGIRVIDYESGVHRSVEAAVRGSIMGGLGLMQEQISQQDHDDLGADGWEISAHAASAPDHEPIQGRQYSDAEYQVLNNSLARRIGTLNCGHAAFPIILGVTSPQYTDEELREFREKNEAGIDYQGRHYTTYEATQMQRRIERSIRTQKRRILADEATGDDEKLEVDQIKFNRLSEEYRRFSDSAGLRMQHERTEMLGFGPKQAEKAAEAFEKTLLPKRFAALIPREKFVEYALNPIKNPDKALAFSRALGYDINNFNALIDNIRENLGRFPATSKGDRGYGEQYEVRMTMTGPNGKTAGVITAWIDDKDTKEMRLVSAYVDKKRGGSQ